MTTATIGSGSDAVAIQTDAEALLGLARKAHRLGRVAGWNRCPYLMHMKIPPVYGWRFKDMADLSSLPNKLDPTKGTCRAIIETPKGSRNKFDYDPPKP